jgi:threonine aldolase
LEELAAKMTGKEAGLFVTSGIQGNQVAVMVHARRCSEVICEATAHMFGSEAGGIAALTGAQPYPVTGIYGRLTPELIEPAIRKKTLNSPWTSLITVENTHNHAGGTYYTPAELAAIRNLANQYSLHVHMDGARIFNAAVAQGLRAAELACYADSIQFCLSKGLCAPVGSMLVGTSDFIAQARRYRKLLGGGMRQAGVIAAAGIVALTTMVDRLQEDHKNARKLGEAIAETKLKVDLATVQTNIVMVDVSPAGKTAAQFIELLREQKILASEFGKYQVRMVTHRDVSGDNIDYVIKILRELAGK